MVPVPQDVRGGQGGSKSTDDGCGDLFIFYGRAGAGEVRVISVILKFYNAISHNIIISRYFLDWYKFYKFLCRTWDYLE